MKVAYIFMSDHAREILENMILPQMEAGVHGADESRATAGAGGRRARAG